MSNRTLWSMLVFGVLSLIAAAGNSFVRAQPQPPPDPPSCDGSQSVKSKCTYFGPVPAPKEQGRCDNNPNASGGCDSFIAYNEAHFFCTPTGSATVDCKQNDGTVGKGYNKLCRENGVDTCYIWTSCKVVDVKLDNGNTIKSCATDSTFRATKATKVDGPCLNVCFSAVPIPRPTPLAQD